MALDLICSEFEDGDSLPIKYSAMGDNVNPPLNIEGVPEDAESLVLIVDDINNPQGQVVHWMMWNISPGTRKLYEDEVPEDAIEGYNDFGEIGYHGPKADANTPRLVFHLYALDTDLELDEDVSRQKLEKEIAGHILDETALMVEGIE